MKYEQNKWIQDIQISKGDIRYPCNLCKKPILKGQEYIVVSIPIQTFPGYKGKKRYFWQFFHKKCSINKE